MMKVVEANKIFLDVLNNVSETKQYKENLNNGKGDEFVLKYIYLMLKAYQEESELIRKMPEDTEIDYIITVDKYLKYFEFSKGNKNYKYIRHAIILVAMHEISPREAIKETAKDYKIEYNKSYTNAIATAVIYAKNKNPEKWKALNNNTNKFPDCFIELIAYKLKNCSII